MLQLPATPRLLRAAGSGRIVRGAGAALLSMLFAFTGLVQPARASPGVASDQYLPPAGPEDSFSVRSPEAGEHMQLTLRANIDYVRNPLVYETRRGSSETERVALVRDQLRLWLGGSLALWKRWLVFARLPLDLVMAGEALGELPTATGFGLGDLGLGIRGLIWEAGALRLGMQLSATLPTAHTRADTPSVAGDSGATLIPRVLGELRFGWIRLGLDLGLRLRRTVALPSTRISHQLLFALAVRAPLAGELLHASAELFGTTLSADPGRRDTTSLQALLGLGARLPQGWSFGLAAGPGLLRGYGTPDWRILARAVWNTQLGPSSPRAASPARAAQAQPATETAPVAPPPTAEVPPRGPRDVDRDGQPDGTDACPAFAAPDSQDGCPSDLSYDRRSGAIVLRPAPAFAPGSPRLLAASLDGLQTLAVALHDDPNLRLMLSTHLDPTSRRGPRDLGARRARALGQWLSVHAVPATQVELYDCGTARPLPAPANSERIELYLLSPLPERGAPDTLGCSPLTLQP